MMKIFMICDVALDGRDAQATHVGELYRRLSLLNEVRLFGPKPRGRFPFAKTDNVLWIPSISVPFVRRLVYEMLLLVYLTWHCACSRPHVLYVRYSIHLFVPALVSLFFSIPMVLEVNGLPLDEIRMKAPHMNRWRRCLKVLSARLSEEINYRGARKIIAVTANIRSDIMERYAVPSRDVIVISNGVDTTRFIPMGKPVCHEKLKLASGISYICFVGNLSIWQGVDHLIRAVPLILDSCADVNLLIVGDGELREELEDLAERLQVSSHVLFTGAVAHEAVPLFINASDVAVVFKRPLKSGYSPLKLYEYMACGIPVVASRVPGFEVLERVRAGVLVEPGNPAQLSDTLIDLLNNREQRESMGRRGREFVVRDHSWQKVAETISKICRDVR